MSRERSPAPLLFRAWPGRRFERWLQCEPIQARRSGPFTRGKKWLQRNPTVAALAVSLVFLAAAVSVIVWKSGLFVHSPATIAVLPFENLSENKENASFADGVQDDILTKLAKIAALRVISRTSVMQYRGGTKRSRDRQCAACFTRIGGKRPPEREQDPFKHPVN